MAISADLLSPRFQQGAPHPALGAEADWGDKFFSLSELSTGASDDDSKDTGSGSCFD